MLSVYATIEGFHKYPKEVWELTKHFTDMAANAMPNDAHKVIAQMYQSKMVHAVITQNVDSLHQVQYSSH